MAGSKFDLKEIYLLSKDKQRDSSNYDIDTYVIPFPCYAWIDSGIIIGRIEFSLYGDNSCIFIDNDSYEIRRINRNKARKPILFGWFLAFISMISFLWYHFNCGSEICGDSILSFPFFTMPIVIALILFGISFIFLVPNLNLSVRKIEIEIELNQYLMLISKLMSKLRTDKSSSFGKKFFETSGTELAKNISSAVAGPFAGHLMSVITEITFSSGEQQERAEAIQVVRETFVTWFFGYHAQLTGYPTTDTVPDSRGAKKATPRESNF